MMKCLKVKVFGYRWGDIVKSIENDPDAKNEEGFWKDDRGILVNMYHRLHEAFEVSEDITNNFIRVAVNEAAKRDERIMLDIATRFGYSLPEYMRLTD